MRPDRTGGNGTFFYSHLPEGTQLWRFLAYLDVLCLMLCLLYLDFWLDSFRFPLIFFSLSYFPA